tara:strand:- start:549 stop:1484 length:936 start_codon:yes stop_codon:yes gene_type:complete
MSKINIYYLSLFICLSIFFSCFENKGTSSSDISISDNIYTISHDGISREYYLYIPDSYNESVDEYGVPLMLNFHGGGGNPQSQLYISDMRSLADEQNFILIYPQGSPEGNNESSNSGYIWNTMYSSENNKSDADDFGFIEALIDEISSNYNIDQNRVYACGYSNGAGFTYSLACYLSDKIAAIAPVSGLMWEEVYSTCNSSRPIPMIIFNGTSDSERPYEGLEGYLLSVEEIINYWTNFNNCNSSPITNSINHNGRAIDQYVFSGGDNNTSVEHYKFNGGGHDWFDINYEGSNLDDLIWEFVSRYDMNGLR